VTGEGIETEQQLHVLKGLGCHFGQGYLISHPMPGNCVRRWIDSMQNAG